MGKYSFEEVNEIALNNQFGEELILEKKQKIFSNKKYKEIVVPNTSLITGNIAQSALTISSQSLTLSQLTSQFPNGLFTATVNPELLSKFTDGTTSTMLKDASGKISGHSGFKELTLNTGLNPALAVTVAMQTMAAISGTYYLHKINKRLEKIDSKLEELINLHHDEKIGVLISTRKNLIKFFNRNNFDVVDLNEIRSLRNQLSSITEEYEYRLNRVSNELLVPLSFEEEERKLIEINFTLLMINESSKLVSLARILEIIARLKINGYCELVKELIIELEDEHNISFYKNIDKYISDIYLKRQCQTEEELALYKKKMREVFEEVDYLDLKLLVPEIRLLKLGKKTYDVIKNKVMITKSNNKIRVEKHSFDTIKNNVRATRNNYDLNRLVNEILKMPYQNQEIIYVPFENGESKLYIEDIA